MFGRLLNRLRGGAPGTEPAGEVPRAGLPAGAVAYAIGDIHGRADLLDRLLQSIRADCADPGAATVVFLGDYVDRGDDSRDVIDLCLAFGRDWPGEVVFLRGNHEAALLTFLDDPESGQRWLEFGGMPTLMSYGVPDVAAPMSGERLARASDAFRSRLPAEHLDFLERTVLSYRMGGTFFCHAMIDAGFAADEQPAEVLMWGGRTRTPPRDWPYLVVHGHTIVERPVLSAREVNVDTGAYYSGRLTAARLSGDGVELLQT